MNKTGVIYGINGPVIYLKGNTGFEMSEMVYVGKERLVGEVIALTQDTTTVQVFEETTGLKPGEIVEASGDAISVLLAPGILNNIFDHIKINIHTNHANGGIISIKRYNIRDHLDIDVFIHIRRHPRCLSAFDRNIIPAHVLNIIRIIA